MTTVEQVKARKDSLHQRMRARWDEWSAQRTEKLRDIKRRGILAAAGTISAARRMSHTTVAEGRTFEALVGGDDTDHVNFLTRGWRAGRSVCRIVFGNTAIGSGFLIAPSILITNNHVVADQRDALGFSAEFDFERDIDGNPMTPRRFAFDPERLFVTSPQELLDFTVVALRGSADGQEIARYGWLPMDERVDKILEGEPVVVSQHPLGREKRICLFNSELEFRTPDNFIQYTTDTELGSSGSPAFNRQWQVVGLHHASVPTGETRQAKPVIANEGVRVSSIIRALREGSGAGAPLVEYPAGARQDALALITDPRVLRDGRPTAPVDVGIPAAPAARPAPQLEAAPTVIRRRPVAHYAGRRGYQERFLAEAHGSDPRFIVPLPKVPDFLADDVVALTESNDTVLRYHHYSVVVSSSRRLAFFSAANLDGATLDDLQHSLDRRDRDPDHPMRIDEAAADVWFFDPRIPEDKQLPPDVYDRTNFDFGHITRRLDPVWGDPRDKRIGNDDSFHMTNCAPQHKNLNQRTWARLEDAAYRSAQKNGMRVNVVSGPVLDPRDPEILGVQTPTAFWKIIAYVENNQLVAQGFMQWQPDLVEEIRRQFEALPQLTPAQEWRTSVREIGRLTGLDFGPLVDADPLSRDGRVRERLNEAMVDRLFPSHP